MGRCIKINEIKKDCKTYSVEYLTGFPFIVQQSYMLINYDKIIQSNTEPIKVENHQLIGMKRTINEAIYYMKPSIIVFDAQLSKDFNHYLKLFNERFINKLNCPYAIDQFNSYVSEYFEFGNAFSVALFEKTEDEIVTFVVDFLAKAHISGASIKSDIFKATLVKIKKN